MQTQPQQQPSVLAWHFLKESSVMRDGNVAPADGVKLVFDDKPVLCVQGLHASLQPFDALFYAPGPVLCLVRCEGTIVYGNDKIVCTERTILARIDATELLWKFAREQALKVMHFWDAPDIVVRYLQTGDESLRAGAARAASNAVAAADAARAARAAARAAGYAAEAAAYTTAHAADAAYVVEYTAYSAMLAAYSVSIANSAYAAARTKFNTLVEEAFDEYLKNS